ncbi:hypothetical protein CLOM_g4490 [Closterium sp. NIES-68]|nr:hypothetical protein CLOM_g4490 [Closterium sp. NIES-68]
MRLPVGETPPLGEENVSPNEGGEEQRGESSEDKRESPREKAGEGAQEWDEEICGSSSFAMRADRHPGEGIPSAGRGGIPSGIAERSRGVSDSRAAGSAEVATSARLSEMGGGDAARLREFEQLRRASRESLLAYYRRVDQLADVISCNEPRIVVAKFLDGLSRDLVGTVRDHTYNLRPNATLRQAYAIAWRNEQSLSMYDLGKRAERTMPHERDRRGCREPGHFKRDCPKLQSCTYCQRKGHAADDCYTKQREERSRGGRRSRIEALEEELRKLKGEAEGSEEEED